MADTIEIKSLNYEEQQGERGDLIFAAGMALAGTMVLVGIAECALHMNDIVNALRATFMSQH